MKLKRNDSTPETRDFWTYVDSVVVEVKSWPKWMRGDEDVTGIKNQSIVESKKQKTRSPGLTGR